MSSHVEFYAGLYKKLLMAPTAGNDIGGDLSDKVTEYLTINLFRECCHAKLKFS